MAAEALSMGKAANVVYTHGGMVHEYEDLAGVLKKLKINYYHPLLLQQLETGSEISTVSVITDTKRKIKNGDSKSL